MENFRKYEHKIIYIIADFKLDNNSSQHKGGESLIEQHQRNNIFRWPSNCNKKKISIGP